MTVQAYRGTSSTILLLGAVPCGWYRVVGVTRDWSTPTYTKHSPVFMIH